MLRHMTSQIFKNGPKRSLTRQFRFSNPNRTVFSTPDLTNHSLEELKSMAEVPVAMDDCKIYQGEKNAQQLPHGQGIYRAIFNSRAQIVVKGIWNQGLIEKGQIITQDAQGSESKYEGHFEEGMKSGYGVYYENNTLRYKGSWQFDHMFGNMEIYTGGHDDDNQSHKLIHYGLSYKGAFADSKQEDMYLINGNFWNPQFLERISAMLSEHNLYIQSVRDAYTTVDLIEELPDGTLGLFAIMIPGHVYLMAAHKIQSNKVDVLYLNNLHTEELTTNFTCELISELSMRGIREIGVNQLKGTDVIKSHVLAGYCSFNTLILIHALASAWIGKENKQAVHLETLVKETLQAIQQQSILSQKYLSVLQEMELINFPVLHLQVGREGSELMIDYGDEQFYIKLPNGDYLSEQDMNQLVKNILDHDGTVNLSLRFFGDLANEAFPLNFFKQQLLQTIEKPEDLMVALKKHQAVFYKNYSGTALEIVQKAKKQIPGLEATTWLRQAQSEKVIIESKEKEQEKSSSWLLPPERNRRLRQR